MLYASSICVKAGILDRQVYIRGHYLYSNGVVVLVYTLACQSCRPNNKDDCSGIGLIVETNATDDLKSCINVIINYLYTCSDFSEHANIAYVK